MTNSPERCDAMRPYYQPAHYDSGWPPSTRFYLLAWRLTASTVYRLIPTRLFGLRNMVLRLFGARIDRTAIVYPTCRIYSPAHLTLGPRSCLSAGVDCYCVDRIDVDADVTVSQEAFLCTASHDLDDPGRRLVTAPIRIGRGAWVFARAIVLPGVTVGEGAVAAAGAVVTRDVPDFAVVAGNPAKEVRIRRWRGRSSHS